MKSTFTQVKNIKDKNRKLSHQSQPSNKKLTVFSMKKSLIDTSIKSKRLSCIKLPNEKSKSIKPFENNFNVLNNIQDCNTTIIEDLLEKEGKKIIAHLSDSIQEISAKKYIINSCKLLHKDTTERNSRKTLNKYPTSYINFKFNNKQKSKKRYYSEILSPYTIYAIINQTIKTIESRNYDAYKCYHHIPNGRN